MNCMAEINLLYSMSVVEENMTFMIILELKIRQLSAMPSDASPKVLVCLVLPFIAIRYFC